MSVHLTSPLHETVSPRFSVSARWTSPRCLNAFLHNLYVDGFVAEHSDTPAVISHIVKLINTAFEHYRSAFERQMIDVLERWEESVFTVAAAIDVIRVICDGIVIIHLLLCNRRLLIASQSQDKISN